ncbi:hypothetical protein LCGC14_1753350 [marine sediment metagenome]|uniref:Activator of Hsp90 ATPase homologue 1/2-like C-terminal domain-containing protein n=1 Tax=marine sediment metagenome TaxID=412755 RepID=A0A0F9H376_9ZZZZ|nr:SRPBCC domain-containing protein [bacterium]
MENIIQFRVEIDCDIKTAFDMFTENKLLEKWLTNKAEVELKVGGKYELFWDPDNREDNSTIGCKTTGFENDKFISFDWKGPLQFKSFMNFADPLTHVIAFFSQEKNNPNKTIIHLFHTGWRKDPEWQEARNWFERSWESAFKVLKDKIKNKTLP